MREGGSIDVTSQAQPAESLGDGAAPATVSMEIMRRVAEAVRAHFPRDAVGPELVLIDVDPRQLHAFWTIPPTLVAAARQALGDDDALLVLRVFERTDTGDGPWFDVQVQGLQANAYVDIWGEARRYRAELGVLSGTGRFHVLARSSPAILPNLGSVATGADADRQAATRPELTSELLAGGHPALADATAAATAAAIGLAHASAGNPQAASSMESVLTVSSFALGTELVDLEINAEIHIYGRARPGTQLMLFGRKVMLRPDGTFSITRPLPNGALVLSALLTGGE